jgi:hypothetical protein
VAIRQIAPDWEELMPQDIRRTLAPSVLALLLTAGATGTAAGQEEPLSDARDPTLARVLSGVGTFTPLILAHQGNESLGLSLGGMILGPLPGYVYAGELRAGLTQAVIRTAVFGAGYGSLVPICSTSRCNMWDDGGQWLTASTLFVTGAFTAIGLGIYDVHRVGRVTAARNERLGTISVQPTYALDGGRAGIALTLRH